MKKNEEREVAEATGKALLQSEVADQLAENMRKSGRAVHVILSSVS